jgi:radical SAM protein with 4Fe4S-binding SPASM domain
MFQTIMYQMGVPWRNFRRFLGKVFKQPLYTLEVLIKRGKAYLSYYGGNGRASFPEAITLFLTHRCNLRCKMCGQWGESGVTRKMPVEYIKQELTLGELKSFIDNVSFFKPNITLFGGEPLLHPSCIELIKCVKKRRMHCLMITNGFLLDDFAQEIVESGLDELNVSLDGGRDLHDQIRGMKGLFDKITAGLKEVSRIKKEKYAKRPIINLQCTITQYNYKYLEQLIEVAENVGADSLTYHNLIFLGAELIEKQKSYDRILNCSSKEWEGFVFKPQIEPDELYAEIRHILKGKYSFSVDFYPNLSLKGLREYYNKPSYAPLEYPRRCISPWMVAYVFPDGEVKPCLNFSYSYGNIKKEKFTNIWNNEKAVTFRKTLKESSIFPVCVRCTELYRY